MCLRLMDTLFDDKRFIMIFLVMWLTIVIALFQELGLNNTQFMTLGPSTKTVFMGVMMDSWYKWGLVAGFTFVNTAVNDFMSDAISPWVLNTITDHKTKYIPYPKWVCVTITQIWSLYCNIMSVFAIFLAMSQVDFVIIRAAADLCNNAYTTTKFLRNKTHCPERYRALDGEAEMTQLKPSDAETPPQAEV